MVIHFSFSQKRNFSYILIFTNEIAKCAVFSSSAVVDLFAAMPFVVVVLVEGSLSFNRHRKVFVFFTLS